MSSNKALFLAGACGALAMLVEVGELLTHLTWLSLFATVALIPGVVLLVIAYYELFREWRERRWTRRMLRGVDTSEFRIELTPDEEAANE